MTISPINLGSTFSSGGTSVTSGLSSGLNTEAVINSLVASQSSQITTLNDQVTVNNSKTTALSTLQQLLTQIQTSVTQLSNPQSPDSSSNVFAGSSVSVNSNTTQAASNYLTATASADTPSGNYTISDVTSIATQTTQQSSAFTVSPSATPLVVASGAVSGQFNAGTFTIEGPSGSGSVTFNTGDTLNDIAADFNAASSSTGLTAAVTNSSGTYTLSFTNTGTNQAAGFSLTDSTDVTSDPSGVLSAQSSSTYTLAANTQPVVVASGAGSSQFNAGTYTITGPTGSSTVTLNTGDSLTDVATDFNNSSSATGITASVLQTSPGVYELAFSSTGTGADTVFDLGDGTDSPLTVSDGNGNPLSLGGVTFTTPVAGTDASFDLNGVPITRSTNTISDLISGVTINLLQNTAGTPGASFTLQVSPDTAAIQTAIDNFATAYNNFLTFYTQQTALNSSGTPASSAVLYSDNTLQTVYNQLTEQAASIVTGLGSGADNQLASIGLGFFDSAATSTTPAVANMLSVDDSTLDSAITTNLSAVENIFGYNMNTSSTQLSSYQNATDPTVSSFTLNIDTSASPTTYTATYTDNLGAQHNVNFTASTLGTGGEALTADPTSALAGMVLIYTGNGTPSSITATITQGIAFQMNNFVASALTANTGLLAVDESGIATQNTTLQNQITSVTTQVANQRAELLEKYSALESAISEANSSLNLLNAQQSAASGS